MKDYITLILLCGIVLLLIRLSWTDITTRIISNHTVIMLWILIIPFAYFLHHKVFLLSATITLLIGFSLFVLNVIGAGDVKLIAVLMLAIPPYQIISFLFFTSILGLGIIIVGWLFSRQSIKQNGLPYGVAISLGFITNLALFNL